MPTAFETFVCDECKGVDFGFEGARAPLRYTGVGKEIVHTLKYEGYTRVM
jgi:predicted amidophosphoribosyltransferase